MKRIHVTFQSLALCVLLAFPLWTHAESETNRYNVLFIAIDDLRTELGCYGQAHVPSPNLDRLASEGMLFNRHFVQVPTCGASRYSLLTGRLPQFTGATRGNNHFYNGKTALDQTLTPGAQTLPELFRRSGYHTVNIGKISHTADGRVFAYDGTGDGRPEMPHAWDDLATPFGQWNRGWGVFFAYANGVHREDGNKHQDLMEFVVEKDTDLPDGLNAETAIAKLKELKGSQKPFFMGLGFYKPHLPFVAPREDWEAVQDIDAPDAPYTDKPNSPYWHNSNEFFRYDMPFPKTFPLEKEGRMQARRAYWACVRYADRQVGKVLDALDDLGMRENTIVVVWGDHGWNLGDGQLWAKHIAHERALNSTLMIRVPGITKPGSVSDAIVQTVDLYPTLVDLCQPTFQKTEYPLNGKSMRALLDGTQDSIQEYSISHWGKATSIRTDRYRLVANRKKSELEKIELFDISESVDPIRNIEADNPEIRDRLLGLIPND